MQLGKDPGQENVYCSIQRESDLIKQLDGRYVPKDDVLRYVQERTTNLSEVRIIRLKRKNT